jgi:hypothetical protein
MSAIITGSDARRTAGVVRHLRSAAKYLGLVIDAVAALALTRIAAVARRNPQPGLEAPEPGGHDLHAVGATRS